MTDLALKRIAIACWLNFMAFVAAAIVLGGDALNGRVSAGHYFLGSHGRFVAVSKPIFIYSACHAASAIVGILAFLLIGRRLKMRSSTRGGTA